MIIEDIIRAKKILKNPLRSWQMDIDLPDILFVLGFKLRDFPLSFISKLSKISGYHS